MLLFPVSPALLARLFVLRVAQLLPSLFEYAPVGCVSAVCLVLRCVRCCPYPAGFHRRPSLLTTYPLRFLSKERGCTRLSAHTRDDSAPAVRPCTRHASSLSPNSLTSHVASLLHQSVFPRFVLIRTRHALYDARTYVCLRRLFNLHSFIHCLLLRRSGGDRGGSYWRTAVTVTPKVTNSDATPPGAMRMSYTFLSESYSNSYRKISAHASSSHT